MYSIDFGFHDEIDFIIEDIIMTWWYNTLPNTNNTDSTSTFIINIFCYLAEQKKKMEKKEKRERKTNRKRNKKNPEKWKIQSVR